MGTEIAVTDSTRERVRELKDLCDGVCEDPRSFPYYRRLKSITLPQLLTSERYQSLARDLCNEYLKSSENQLPFLHLLYLALMVTNVQGRIIAENHDEKQSTEYGGFLDALALYAAYKIALRYPSSFVLEHMQKFWEIFKEKYKDSMVSLFFMNFELCLTNIYGSVEMVKELTESISEEVPDCEEESRELKSSADELWMLVSKLQRYTIKQSLYSSAIGKQAQWAILDHRQIQSEHSLDFAGRRLKMQFESFAIFTRCIESEAPSSLDTKIIHSEEQSNKKVTKATLETSFRYDMQFLLGADGELYHTAYPIKVPLRPIFKKQNSEGAYQFLRMHSIARVYDMVVPRVIIDQLPPLDGIKTNSSRRHANRRVAVGIIQDIMLPRVIKIRATKDVQKEIDREKRECEDYQKEGKSRRFLGRVGHPRILPHGYRPHQDAKELAKEDGFYRELEDNETWCRPVDSLVPVVHRQKTPK